MSEQEMPQAPQVDVRRVVLLALLVVGGLAYFFWDPIRDVLKPPEIVERTVPSEPDRPDIEISVRAGALNLAFTRIGAAVKTLTWTAPDGHVETLLSQDTVPNRAFVIDLPGSEDWAGQEFALRSGPARRQVRLGRETVDVVELVFARTSQDGGIALRKTFRIETGRPVIHLAVTLEIRNRSSASATWLREKGYTLTVCNAVGIPSDLEKDDVSIAVRADALVRHHRVRRISGSQSWPTEEEQDTADHRGGIPTLEWVATGTRYFGIILRPTRPISGAEMTFTRTADTAAAVDIQVPPPDPGLDRVSHAFQIYTGPKHYDALAALPGRMQECIDYWWFGRLTTLLLRWVHDRVVPNYGVAIILVTIAFRILMWPVTRANLRAMVDLRVANARLADIDAREPPRSEVEAHEYWLREARVWEKVQGRATLGAVLPLAILLPVLLVLYYTLRAGYEFYRQPFVLWITDISRRDPLFILPVLMGLAMMGQLRTMSENPSRERSWILLPAAFTLLFAFFSAGLVIFWLTDSLVGWGQLVLIRRGRRRRDVIAEAEAKAEAIRKEWEARRSGRDRAPGAPPPPESPRSG